jgi:orotate phosphoribosyltransferase
LKDWQIDLIKYLVKKNGLLFGDFRLKSGRLSPYFFNLAKVIDDGEGLQKISEFYIKGLFEYFEEVDFDIIIGPAYKAISLAATISMLLKINHNINMKWGYDRKEEKLYGVSSEKWFVGNLIDGDKILIIDDVTTTGKTKIDLIEKIKNSNKNINLEFKAVLIMLDREELDDEGNYVKDVLKSKGINLYSLLKVSEVFDYLRNNPIDGEKKINEIIYRTFIDYNKKYGYFK